ncbi:MAG TPA: D-glycero-beta-D-manno-heptose-7-phosphate kinase [Bacteroidetes bacterium]|nr:D-glycero-beta-D-manno-heptose-7-phosphate kinase [Bacteroidota bacterium]
MKSSEKIFSKFPSLRIVVIGDVMLDRYLWGSVDRISPEAPVPVVSIHKKESRLGGAANVALNLKALGVVPVLLSVTGRDEEGKKLILLLSDSEIDSSGIIQSATRITSVKSRVLSKNHQMIRFDEEATHDISRNDEEQLFSLLKKNIESKKVDAVIFEDYNKGVLTKSFIPRAIELCSKNKIATFVDPKKNNFFSYRNATLFKPNLREVSEALGRIVMADTTDLTLAHEQLKRQLHHQNTFITLGEKGAFIHDGKNGYMLDAHIRNVADVSGAGDTVISVVAAAMCAGAEMNDAAYLANLAGGLVCEKPGVVTIELNQLINELKN